MSALAQAVRLCTHAALQVTLRLGTVAIVEAAESVSGCDRGARSQSRRRRDREGCAVSRVACASATGRILVHYQPIGEGCDEDGPMSPENQAKLAQNLVTARAARAAKTKTAKKATRSGLRKKS